ncbi:MAG: tRNA (adenosine(37)-N6)-dimethylallyltransferase MiaA [Firmicutes bacterium]|nr:tRNA (adenosine(37)-N6)-dimethylallyltransferase MiaA [Bacillota bacterium]
MKNANKKFPFPEGVDAPPEGKGADGVAAGGVLVICGPTAVGKSGFALEVCTRLNAEIVSSDSLLVYKGLDIGTAKPTPAERKLAPHYMIDIISPLEEFNAECFVSMAKKCIYDIQARGKLPVIVGGTGFYLEALLSGYSFKIASGRGIEKTESNALIVCLTQERSKLYAAIDARVDGMIAAGLISEIQALRSIGVTEQHQSMQAIGYKELIPYLNGEIGLGQATENIKQASRNYAKRQLTWFRGMKNLTWVTLPDERNSAMGWLNKTFSEYKLNPK